MGDIEGRVYLVQLPKPKRNRFGARTRYAVVGKGFPTHSSAEAVGQRVQVALSFLAAERRIGLDAQNRVGAAFSQAIKADMAAKHGVQLRDDIHGLDVYSEEKPVTRIALEAYGSVTHKIENYEERLLAFFQANPTLSAKQLLALDLYNLSHFEGTPKTRFLTLITVVEVLSTRQPRTPAARSVVKSFRESVKTAGLTAAERNALSDALSNLSRQSIGEACRELVALCASADNVVYFTSCYNARSDLVHAGRTQRVEAVDPTKLDELVSNLLIRSIAGEV
ncbi:MAG: hypothetical protein M3436_18730 [Pseudomonadota bacterium]|nr:hypothetical protein [Pseudomonadota bacterium]